MDKKILIADDSAFMRKILVDILKNGGYSNLIEVENGKQAMEKISSEKPDLVLLDIIMPEMDGMEVVKQVGKQMNVVMISAIGQEGVIDEAKALGAKGFVVKPFDNNKVLEEIKSALG